MTLITGQAVYHWEEQLRDVCAVAAVRIDSLSLKSRNPCSTVLTVCNSWVLDS